jgi:hypothetical protein
MELQARAGDDDRATSVKSKYNNYFIAKLINIFIINIEERRKEKEKSLTFVQAICWISKHRH